MIDLQVHTDENCINTDDVMISNIQSGNKEMSGNETHKLSRSTTFNQDNISISESVIAQKHLYIVEKEKVNSNQTNLYTTLQKCYLPAALMILICIIVMILQIPTVLYYTDPPSAEPMLYENINVETCSVS